MIMMPLELHDLLVFEPHDDIILISDVNIPDNAIIKAAQALQAAYNIEEGAKITLNKNIPIGAGLAGGSADIAATLRGLNALWRLNEPLEALEPIALSLGSDTLFCLHNKTAFVSGRGETILFLPEPPFQSVVLYPYQETILTQRVFAAHTIKQSNKTFDRALSHYLNQRTKRFIKSMYNDLEKTTHLCYPEVKKHQQQVHKIDKHAMMTGSGATYFSLIWNDSSEKIIKNIEKSPLKHIKTKPKT
jgi:4-diphosphocytidyl-2-C-methyl-D-erythritol kinase